MYISTAWLVLCVCCDRGKIVVEQLQGIVGGRSGAALPYQRNHPVAAAHSVLFHLLDSTADLYRVDNDAEIVISELSQEEEPREQQVYVLAVAAQDPRGCVVGPVLQLQKGADLAGTVVAQV